VIVVADAGPSLHLHWIGCLPWGLPPTPIHVVEQVWTEITQHAPEALADPRLEREPVVEIDLELQAKFSLHRVRQRPSHSRWSTQARCC
jgi:hypothetical protein